jgi:5-deoxy-glucuronate isomerase
MRQYTAENLIIHPQPGPDTRLIVEVTPETAGWETITFQVRRIASGERWSFETGECELALVVLGGVVDIASSCGEWPGVGGRSDVFAGLPHALYLPLGVSFSVTSATGAEFAIAFAPAARAYEPRLVTPANVNVEIRGGDHATRQINQIMPPGFPCDRLVVVEVYTPGGNWSSYPPHKHDVHRVGRDGALLQADLDEIYYYKIDPPEGYALQRIYTDAESPLHAAGSPIDAAVIARANDVVLIPEGYHPVSSPVGFTSYYLNILAGSAQSLASKDDPIYAWIKDSYQTKDPRVPIYPVPSP